MVPLTSELEPAFWRLVERDIPHHFFFAFDWKYRRDETRILLALDRGRIDGMMLIYRGRIVQLRGSGEAVRALLEGLELEEVELVAEPPHERYVLERYVVTTNRRLHLMILRRGEERSRPSHPTVELGASDAEEIAGLMRSADPEHWGEVTGQQVTETMREGVSWLGVRVGGRLVSVGSARLTEWVGLVRTVATHEAYRNRGYATSVVSELVHRMLRRVHMAIIYVLGDNWPAIRVYEKVGFRKYRTYLLIRGKGKFRRL
mgnify:CR=1 FL=1